MTSPTTQRRYTIKEAAALTGLPASTLRYYESIGVIPPVSRGASSGHRAYGEDDLDQLMWVSCLAATGMSVNDMRTYIANGALGPAAARDQIDLLAAQQQRLAEEAEQRDCVSEAARAGRTILLSSHILGEVERLCSHVTIIREGRTVESGSLAQMRHLASSTVVARCAPAVAEAVANGVTALGVVVERHDLPGGESRLECSVPREDIPGVLAVLAERGVTDVTCTPASLEELFLRHYQVASR